MTVKLAEQFPDLVIRASAGTGKTYRLTNRFLGLLYCGESPDRILASTFARKAAGEILERLLHALAEAASTESSRAALERALDLGPLTQAQSATMLETLIRQIHRLRVGTLDSVFIQTAGSFSLEFGLPGGWKILEDPDDRTLRVEALRRLLRQEAGEFNSLITFLGLLQQGDSSRDVLESLLATVDIFYSIFRESDPTAWLGEPALPELKQEQIDEGIERLRDVSLPSHKTIEKSHAAAIIACETEDWGGFVSKGIAPKILAGDTTFSKKPIDDEMRAAYQPLIDHSRAKIVNKFLYQTEATYRLLEKYHAIYHPLKLSRKGLRFEDVTRILSDNLDSARLPQIEYRLDSAIHHLLLDEFQDTSLTQWNVVRHFAHEVNRHLDKTFFCVGDVKQAIYGWRGGESEIFDSVKSELNGVQEEPMDLSYRSSPIVIETVNKVFESISQNPSLLPEKNDTPDLLLPV
ncbi:MAG TPA: UvrD-helicase domain-containing protein, partial [Planctomycetaceae bacterium]|nr:UvrD-helicase domain-containing protein [Planctomycetaceae bacterium]